MQPKTKCSSEAPRSRAGPESLRSTPHRQTGRSGCTDSSGPPRAPGFQGGYSLREARFSEVVLEKLPGAGGSTEDETAEAEAPTAAPHPGPHRGRRGAPGRSRSSGSGPAAARPGRRSGAAQPGGGGRPGGGDLAPPLAGASLAAVLPAVPAENPYHLGRQAEADGLRVYLAGATWRMSRGSPRSRTLRRRPEGPGAAPGARLPPPPRPLLRGEPGALALLIESVGRRPSRSFGRARLARRAEAVLERGEG